jgi:hypothetical protein
MNRMRFRRDNLDPMEKIELEKRKERQRLAQITLIQQIEERKRLRGMDKDREAELEIEEEARVKREQSALNRAYEDSRKWKVSTKRMSSIVVGNLDSQSEAFQDYEQGPNLEHEGKWDTYNLPQFQRMDLQKLARSCTDDDAFITSFTDLKHDDFLKSRLSSGCSRPKYKPFPSCSYEDTVSLSSGGKIFAARYDERVNPPSTVDCDDNDNHSLPCASRYFVYPTNHGHIQKEFDGLQSPIVKKSLHQPNNDSYSFEGYGNDKGQIEGNESDYANDTLDTLKHFAPNPPYTIQSDDDEDCGESLAENVIEKQQSGAQAARLALQNAFLKYEDDSGDTDDSVSETEPQESESSSSSSHSMSSFGMSDSNHDEHSLSDSCYSLNRRDAFYDTRLKNDENDDRSLNMNSSSSPLGAFKYRYEDNIDKNYSTSNSRWEPLKLYRSRAYSDGEDDGEVLEKSSWKNQLEGHRRSEDYSSEDEYVTYNGSVGGRF